jgi:hypothetical protein
MRDAEHCRIQAELCLQIAGLLSDPEAAADLRTQAAGYYLACAAELETQSPSLRGRAMAGSHFVAE